MSSLDDKIKSLAQKLYERDDPAHSVVLMGRKIQRALFAGKADDLLFWAVVHYHFRRHEICEELEDLVQDIPRVPN